MASGPGMMAPTMPEISRIRAWCMQWRLKRPVRGVGDGRFANLDLLQAQGSHVRQKWQSPGRFLGVYASGFKDREQPVRMRQRQREAIILQRRAPEGMQRIRFHVFWGFGRET